MTETKKAKVTFTSFDTKEGETKGKKWVLFLMKTADDRVFSTFDTNFAKTETEFEIEYTERRDGDFVNRRIISPDKPQSPQSDLSVDYDKIREIVGDEVERVVKANVGSLRTATKFIINHLTKTFKDNTGEKISDEELGKIGKEI